VDEAKAVYPFMAIGANIALVAAGCYIRLVGVFQHLVGASGLTASGHYVAVLPHLLVCGYVLVLRVCSCAHWDAGYGRC
jgi:hypothetical protein